MIDLELGYDPEANWHLIPTHMQGGLRRYLTHGIVPGHFLEAVLENDLTEAVKRADDVNIAALPNYIAFFYNYADRRSYGSQDKVREWINAGGAGGLYRKGAERLLEAIRTQGASETDN